MARTKGSKQFAYEIPAEVVDAFREFARSRGKTVSAELVRALKRHMAFPEPVFEEPDPVPYTAPVGEPENPPPARAKKRKA